MRATAVVKQTSDRLSLTSLLEYIREGYAYTLCTQSAFSLTPRQKILTLNLKRKPD